MLLTVNPGKTALPSLSSAFACASHRSERRVKMVPDFMEKDSSDHDVAHYLQAIEGPSNLHDDVVDNETRSTQVQHSTPRDICPAPHDADFREHDVLGSDR
jgi:hypothetical protein